MPENHEGTNRGLIEVVLTEEFPDLTMNEIVGLVDDAYYHASVIKGK